jgi:small subunit ribosomal protein S6
MPVNTYETLFLLDSTKVTADADGVTTQVHHVLEKHGGHVLISRPWDYNHKLAYPVKKQKKGAFHIVYYTMDGTKQIELEKDLKLVEVVLRHLTSVLDPKWQENILEVAREDKSTGFALRGMQDEAQVQTDPAAIGAEPAPGGEGGHGGHGGEPAGAGGGFRRGGGRRFEGGEKPEER